MNLRPALLAGALCAATVPTFAQDVTVYGRVDMSYSYQSRLIVGGRVTDRSLHALDSGGNSGSRLGFRGREDLGGGYGALFLLEQGIQADTGQLGQAGRAWGRQAYVGLDTPFGRVTLGRQYTPWFETLSFADPFGNNMVANSGNLELANARADNSVLYRSPSLGGLVGQLMVAAGEGTAARQINVAAHYKAGGFWGGLVYGEVRQATEGKFGLVGGSYDFGPVKLFANYSKVDDLNPVATAAPTLAPGAKGSAWLVGVSAPFAGGSLMASVVDLDDERAANRDARQYGVGYLYPLSKRTALYAAHSRIVNRNGGVLTVNTPSYVSTAEQQTQLGVTHGF